MVKWIWRIFLVAMVVMALLILGRNSIGAWIIEGKLRKATGFPVNVEFLSIKLTQPRLMAREITITNPKDFYNEPRAMKIDLFEVDYKPLSIFQGKPHFQKLWVDISEVVAVRNASGELNLRRFQRPKSEADEKTSGLDIQIDELVLSIGTISYIDEQRENAKPLTYPIHAKNRTYRNIQNIKQIKSLVLNLVIESTPPNVLGITKESIDLNIQNIRDTMDQKSKNILDFFGTPKQENQSP